MKPRLLLTLAMGLFFLGTFSPVAAQELQETATFSVVVDFDERTLDSLDVQFHCSSGAVSRNISTLAESGSVTFLLEGGVANATDCLVWSVLPEGYWAEYSVSGEGGHLDDNIGCQFELLHTSQENQCDISVLQEPVGLTVYKKWYGGSGQEQDIRVSLSCESGEVFEDRYVNEGAPAGWDVGTIFSEGMLCNVTEEIRDTFRPDIIDCQGLFLLPGKGEECIMINTKIVKRIELLNRYGKVIMIILILGVGLIAVRRQNI